MNHVKPRSWTEHLIEETRTALQQPAFSSNGYIHFKHWQGVFGQIRVSSILGNRYQMEIKGQPHSIDFATIDDVIDAGWVID